MKAINGKRMAVLVGCNYPNTEYELQGCFNDVIAMKHMLIKRFGFDEKDIELLSDEEGSSVLPTGANIKKALGNMVDRAMEGDVLYFYYSGHGTLIPSLKQNEPHRKDEAIVPYDFNLITDHLSLERATKGDYGILLSGCQSNETSADVSSEEGEGGEAHGAFSNAVQKVLEQNSGRLSNKEVVIMARKVLQEQMYKQHPCLYCSDKNADATFLLQL
uniref:Peptidase C14 caspase domain-containing protein n=1 Tax=Chenopodium quinoa TaxID=63459 RepID=A0A803LZS0_CHEQI